MQNGAVIVGPIGGSLYWSRRRCETAIGARVSIVDFASGHVRIVFRLETSQPSLRHGCFGNPPDAVHGQQQNFGFSSHWDLRDMVCYPTDTTDQHVHPDVAISATNRSNASSKLGSRSDDKEVHRTSRWCTTIRSWQGCQESSNTCLLLVLGRRTLIVCLHQDSCSTSGALLSPSRPCRDQSAH